MEQLIEHPKREGVIWDKWESLLIWRSSETEKSYLAQITERTIGAIDAAFASKNKRVIGKIDNFIKPESCNYDKHFKEFHESKISGIIN